MNLKYNVEPKNINTYYTLHQCRLSNIKTKQPHTKLVKLQGILIRKFRMIGGFSGLDNILFLKPRGGYMGVHFITI